MIKQHKLYLIEDDMTIVNLLKRHFEQDYQVYAVSNFRDIKQEVESIQPDVILMDITLPFFNGFYWTSEIRKTMTVPIIFISSSNDEMDMIMALNMGGDDFVSKPFSLSVMEAKISAFLRRSKHFSTNELTFKGYHLEADGQVISPNQERVSLSPTEFKILRILMTYSTKVIAKEDFLEQLWQDGSFIAHNTFYRFQYRLKILQTLKAIEDWPRGYQPFELAYHELAQRLIAVEAANLLRAQQEKSDLEGLVKMWSHQMKVPLSALSLMVQTNQLHKSELQAQLFRLERNINHLLSYLKYQKGNDDYRFRKLSVRQCVNAVVKTYSSQCISKQIQIQISGDFEVVSDDKWLSFCISQVIDNAIKYSKIKGMIRIQLNQNSISIQDFGIGILPEDIPRLFEQGFTGYNGHEHQKATGLGLYMTKKILNSLDFDIQVTSHIGEGTLVQMIKQ